MRRRGWLGVLIVSAWMVAACSDDTSEPPGTDQGTDVSPKTDGKPGKTDGKPGKTDGPTTKKDSGKPSGALPANSKVVFLHHSTGEVIWDDGNASKHLTAHNTAKKKSYSVTTVAYPSDKYGWENYPYDYWNIWVNHAGASAYKGQATLEMLAKTYNVIVWKHCYPVSEVEADTGKASVSSDDKRLENYKLQYAALKKKMRSFPKIRFLVWTGAAQTKDSISQAEATRAKNFFAWVKNTWDTKGDNIFVWDFWQLETGGGLYLLPANAESSSDSHPNTTFALKVAPWFVKRLTNVIEGRGDSTSLTGK